MAAKEQLLSALVSVSRDLATATHPDAIRRINQIAGQLLRQARTEPHNGQSISPLASKIIKRCSGQTLDSRTIAHCLHMRPGGSTLKRAIRELLASGHAVKAGAGLYAISEKLSAPHATSPKG